MVHCGKHVGPGVEQGVEQMARTVDEIMQRFDGSTTLRIETPVAAEDDYADEIALARKWREQGEG